MEEDDESHDHSNFAQSRQPLEENLDFSSGPSSACSDSLSDKEAEEVVNQTSTTLDLDENYDDNDFSLIQNYTLKTSETDYYSLLGLSKSPSPSDAQIRSAYRTLTLSFHPDKQPSGSRSRQVAAEEYFETIREAYETLIDPKKRLVYDLLGVDGVKREWGKGGLMRSADTARHARQNGGTTSSRGTRNGRRAVSDDGSEEEVPSPTPKEAGMELGVKSMNPEEFRKWFLESMKARERKVLDEMVAGKGSISLGLDASSWWSTGTMSPSKFSIGYSFRTPLPSFLRRDTEEEDRPIAANRNLLYDSPLSPSPDTVLVISANASGTLQTPRQKMQFKYTDGSHEIKEVSLRPILVGKSFSLGATFQHSLGSIEEGKNVLQRHASRLLSGASFWIYGSILPNQILDASVTQMLTPFEGGIPINATIKTTFNRSPLSALPTLGLGLSRKLGKNWQAYCSWSSGFLAWPSIIQSAMSPILDLSINPESFLQLPMESSKLEIGLASLSDPRIYAEEDLDLAETWIVQVAASPAMGNISLNYGRDLFSGKTQESPRSEWNSEGYYPLTESTEHRSVRLEVNTTIGLNLGVGWSIGASRRISDFTRMGLNVGVTGPNGLILTIEWARLGQKLRFPILVCPLDAVNGDIITLAVGLPWLAYFGVEFGFLRPRGRRKRHQAMVRRQRELKKLIPKRRVESTKAIELMLEQVERRQARERRRDGLVITKAEYGYMPPTSKSTRKLTDPDRLKHRLIDVTVPVAALVDHGQLVISRSSVKFQILGFYDPAPLLPKKLRIWYTFNGRSHMVEAEETEDIKCPLRSHLCLE